MIADKLPLLLACPSARRVMQPRILFFGAIHSGFVLDRNSVDRDSFGFVSLNESDEIACISGIPLRQQMAADHAATVLHPSRRTPRRCEKQKLGVFRSCQFDRR